MRARHIKHPDLMNGWRDRLDTAYSGAQFPMLGRNRLAHDRFLEWLSSVWKLYGGIPQYNIAHTFPYENTYGSNEVAAAIVCPLLVATGLNGTWTNTNFVDTDMDINGLQGNVSNSAYLDTGDTCVSMIGSGASGQVDLYLYTNARVTTAAAIEWGVQEATNTRWQAYGHLNTTFNFKGCRYWDSVGARAAIVADDPMLYCSFAGGGFQSMYRTNGGAPVNINTVAVAGSQPTTDNMYAFANNAGGPVQYSNKRISFIGVSPSGGVDQSQYAAQCIVFLRKQLGGGYV